jgi:hypothetical protein
MQKLKGCMLFLPSALIIGCCYKATAYCVSPARKFWGNCIYKSHCPMGNMAPMAN